MRDTLIAIYSATGVPNISSPWLAVFVPWLVCGVTSFWMGKVTAWVVKTPSMSKTQRSAICAVVVGVAAPIFILSIGLTKYVLIQHGVYDNTLFLLYFLGLFFLSLAPFFYVLRGVRMK